MTSAIHLQPGDDGYDPFSDPRRDHMPVDDEFDGERRMILTAAARIKPRPVRWLWDGRIAIGTLSLLAGREGLGKSTLAYSVAADVTVGRLDGAYKGDPKSVLVCATEDSWEHTIVPRLIAAGANLERVYRVDVVNPLGIHVGLSLPRDISGLSRHASDVNAALLLLDPLMSRLGSLDTHRDAEVRLALEPLVAVADRANLAVLGLIHHNKSGSADPLQLVMGSKAFTAVARSVHTVVADADDEVDQRRLFGTPKNNLGRTDLPTLSFHIASYPVDTEEGTAWTGQLVWGEEVSGSIGDAMRNAADSSDERGATAEAADWLQDYCESQGGSVSSKDARAEGRKAGHSEIAVKRARKKLKLGVRSEGFPRVTYWCLPDESPVGSPVGSPLRGEDLTDLSEPTVSERGQSDQIDQLAQSDQGSRTGDPTDVLRVDFPTSCRQEDDQ